MHSEICPVCKGEGKRKKKKCHGCDGKGWIEVRDTVRPYDPYVPIEPIQYPKILAFCQQWKNFI